MRPLVLYGGGGAAKEMLSTIHDINQRNETWELLGIYDENPNGPFPLISLPYLGTYKDLKKVTHQTNLVVAIADPGNRARIVSSLEGLPLSLVSLRHPTAIINESSHVGAHVSIGSYSVVHMHTVISKNSYIGCHCFIGHDTKIGDNCTIVHGAIIGGGVTIKEGSYVGIGAKILPGVTVGSNCIVGAGAVVVRSVPADSTVVGVPAAPLKNPS